MDITSYSKFKECNGKENISSKSCTTTSYNKFEIHSVEESRRMYKNREVLGDTSNNETDRIISKRAWDVIKQPSSGICELKGDTENIEKKRFRYKNDGSIKNTSSEVLSIENLVRPYTLLQLLKVLSKTGKIVEDGFWVNNIKSKCIVRYESKNQAAETLRALHGTRWPDRNPQLLNVQFSSIEKMQKCVNYIPSPPPVENNIFEEYEGIRNRGIDRRVEAKHRDSMKNNKRSAREFHMDKSVISGDSGIGGDRMDQRRSRMPPRSTEGKDQKLCPMNPSINIDSLYQKTKTKPFIYWQPLTTKQMSVKDEKRRSRIAEHENREKKKRRKESKREKREKESNMEKCEKGSKREFREEERERHHERKSYRKSNSQGKSSSGPNVVKYEYTWSDESQN